MSTSLPRSKIIGRYPFFAKVSPANIPAGPKPTIIGLSFNKTSPFSKDSVTFLSTIATCLSFRKLANTFLSEPEIFTSTTYTNEIGAFL